MSAAKPKSPRRPPLSPINHQPSTIHHSLTIHPTSLSLRQLQRRQLETNAFFDSRGHITFSSLLRDCATAALLSPLPRESRIQNPESRIDNQTGPKSKVQGPRSTPPPSPSTINPQPFPINHQSSTIPHSPPLRPLTDLDRELAIVEAVAHFRSSKAGRGKVLSALAPAALEETLAQLIDTVAPLANRAPDFLALLADDTRTPKNPELAALYNTYVKVCQSLGVTDDATLNAAILNLLAGPREHWPLALRQAGTVTFEAIRWVAPFQESFIQALAARLSHENVIVRHILTDYEQDWWGGALIGGAGRLLFGDPQSAAEDCQYHSPATRTAIEGLTSLREGYAMQDRSLALQARSCVGFSCSVGIYGEIEDLARRIAWELHDRPDPLRPEDICLVTRNLGAASDAIVDVFTRFNIPYYFRRGIPVLSIPIIKTLINLARFSATRERDLFCALLQSPWINWSLSTSPPARNASRSDAGGSTVNREPLNLPNPSPIQLADDILRSGVEPVMDDPDRLARRLTSYVMRQRRFTDRAEAETYAARAVQAWRSTLGNTSIKSFDAGLTDLLNRCTLLGLTSLSAEMGDHQPLTVPPTDPTLQHAFLLNATAWKTVADTIAILQRHALVNRDDGASITWDEIVDLLNRALENITVSAVTPDESGVWVLNPYDIAGLHFKVVLVAGLNAGAFPKSPSPSPLFPDAELLTFREKLLSPSSPNQPSTIPHSLINHQPFPIPHPPIPVAALAASKARNSQENLLFLTTLAAARERLVFSYAAHDETGQELTPSVFFSTLWRLVGWPAFDTLPADPPDPYDQWRLQKEPAHLRNHWLQRTPGKDAFKRRPFPGESYLGTIPLALCRANDERRQRLAHSPHSPESSIQYTEPLNREPSNLLLHIPHAIHVERQRQAFFNRQSQAASTTPAPLSHSPSTINHQPFPPTPGHEYAGVLDASLWSTIRATLKDSIHDFSPTQLERLVACPYQYYLQYILRAEPIEPNDLEPRAEDFGTAIHAIMHTGLRLLQGLPPTNSIPALAPIAKTARRLSVPTWAVRDHQHIWHLQESPEQPSHEAIPLVALPAGATPDLLSFFDTLAETMLDWATSGNAVWRLGAPEQLNLQRLRIRRCIRNLMRATLDPEALPELPGIEPALASITQGAPEARRYPALLEYAFDSRRDEQDGPSIELADPANPDHQIRLHGKIDRVDLVFGADKKLQAIIVVDYKGGAKAKLKLSDLATGIARAADCQLPAYALAAAQALALPSTINHPPSPIPIIMHYLSYTLSSDDMVRQCRKQCISLDGLPLEADQLAEILGNHASLTEAFVASVFAALDRYERGDFAVAPEKCEHCDFQACCRHAASLLDPESTDTGAES